MKRLALLIAASLGGCDFDKDVVIYCQKTGKCDGGVAGAAGGGVGGGAAGGGVAGAGGAGGGAAAGGAGGGAAGGLAGGSAGGSAGGAFGPGVTVVLEMMDGGNLPDVGIRVNDTIGLPYCTTYPCTRALPVGTHRYLMTAVPMRYFFRGWEVGGDCGANGTDDCDAFYDGGTQVLRAEIDGPYNLAFTMLVNNAAFEPTGLGVCTQQASMGGLGGGPWFPATYLHQAEISASRGWLRVGPDRLPFIDQFVPGAHVFYPLNRDESGNPLTSNPGNPPGTNVISGVAVYAPPDAGSCGGFMNASSGTIRRGDWNGGDYEFLDVGMSFGEVGCSQQSYIYCLEAAHSLPLVPLPPPPTARHAYVSDPVSSAAVLTACAPGYVAFVATSTQSAFARVISGGPTGPTYRMDGIRWRVDQSPLSSEAALDVLLDGGPVPLTPVSPSQVPVIAWTGALRPDAMGMSVDENCGDWTGGGVYGYAGDVHNAGALGFQAGAPSCGGLARVYCVESR